MCGKRENLKIKFFKTSASSSLTVPWYAIYLKQKNHTTLPILLSTLNTTDILRHAKAREEEKEEKRKYHSTCT